MKDPAFLFYSSDFMMGCANLTMEERGQYITLLCIQHQNGHLSEKTIKISLGNVSEDVMVKFKKDKNGLFYNDRLEAEIDKRSKFTNSRRENGSLGGRPSKESKEPTNKSNNLSVTDRLTIEKANDKPKKNLPVNENINEIINEISYLFNEKYITKKTNELFEKLLESYSKEQIIKSIVWARNDSFWKTNFLSPNKLLEKDKSGVQYIDVFISKSGQSSYNQQQTLPSDAELTYENYLNELHNIDDRLFGPARGAVVYPLREKYRVAIAKHEEEEKRKRNY